MPRRERYTGDCPNCQHIDDEYERIVGEMGFEEPAEEPCHPLDRLETSSLLLRVVGAVDRVKRGDDMTHLQAILKEIDRRIPRDA